MAGRALWKGSLFFGSANLPVKLHTAIREERIQFHLLHSRDHKKLRQQMVCAYDHKPVPPEEQSKGFELEAGKYIIVDPAELDQAVPEESRMIEVHEFVKSEEIDPVFLDRTYYLEPDNSAEGYALLAGALQELHVAGICTWVMRKRAYLGVLQASGNGLRLHTLRYADEVVPVQSLELDYPPLSEKELDIACDLITKLSGPFQPQKFEDEHQKKLRALIQKKARGEKLLLLPPRKLEPTGPDKLLQALEASLKKVA